MKKLLSIILLILILLPLECFASGIQAGAGASAPPSGSAGGGLTGTYPSPGLNSGSVSAVSPVLTTGSGSPNNITTNNTYFICTTTCTVTANTPVVGAQLCVQNDDNVNTVITLAMPASVMVEAQARTSYGTAGTGHGLTSTGAVGDQICIVGRDVTHYNIMSSFGVWPAY